MTLTLVRHRAQPTAATIVRLTVTAVFAYLLALLLPNASRPVMAPLTALLVVQVSIEQDRLSELLGTDPVARPVGWPLRGELISHLDRFRTELEAGKPDSRPRRRRNRAWRLPHARLQRLPPAWRRLIK